MCLSHLIYTVWPCLIHTCHAMPMPRPCHALTMPFFSRPQHGQSIAWARHGNGMASVNQTRPHCVNQMGKTHSKPLAARHGRGTAWPQHAMCESAFKDVLHLSAECTGQSNSHTDRKIFKRWVFHTCVPSVTEHFCKTGMPEDSKFRPFIDNCTAHSPEFELPSGNISVRYLPPNITPLIQPTDQGVIQNRKCCYRRVFLRNLLNHEGTLKDFQLTLSKMKFSTLPAHGIQRRQKSTL